MKPSVARTFLFIGVPISLGILIVIFGAIELRHFLLSSPRFAVEKVNVLSTGLEDNSELLRLANIPPKANIFSLDLEEIRKKIEKHEWVHSATVVRSLPNEIQVHYRKQEPVAILGADSMYYLNNEGVPFYKIKKGDSLAYPLIQIDGGYKDREILRQRVETSLRILSRMRASETFTEKDLGDLTVRMNAEDGAAPFVLNLRYPPADLSKKADGQSQLYMVSFSGEDLGQQVKRWEAVLRYLTQQSKKPRLIRLELGKKVVVKVER